MHIEKGYPRQLYADLILANLQEPVKKENITLIKPKLLTGMTHRIGGAKDWNDLENIITVAGVIGGAEKENKLKEYLPKFKEILQHYSMNDINILFMTLFGKAGLRDRVKSGLVVENTQRTFDRDSIYNVLATDGIFLDTVYVHFGKDFCEVTSYCPFALDQKYFFAGAYFARVENWENTEKTQNDLIAMLKKENNIIRKDKT